MNKFSIINLLLIICFALGISQEQSQQQLKQMKKVEFLAGRWKGKGWTSFGKGERHYFNQTEDVQIKLGGLIMSIEGIGTEPDSLQNKSKVIHHAFAILAFDKKDQVFKMRSFKDGNYMEADARVNEKGNFIWGFDIPGRGKVRYTIMLNDQGQWYEVGEFSPDDVNWYQNFEMTLEKVGY